jgi:outer membrane protein
LTLIAACSSAHAEGENYLRLHWLKSSETDLTTAFYGDFDASRESNYAIAGSWGRQLTDSFFGTRISMTGNLGVQYFDERGYQSDILGATAYVKALYDWKLPWTQKRVRLGLGEGLSYVSDIPMSEQRDFAKKGADSVNLMNYMEWTVDLPLRQFDAFDNLLRGRVDEMYVGFMVWHRSTIFGLFGEERGGVNFMGFGIEAQF